MSTYARVLSYQRRLLISRNQNRGHALGSLDEVVRPRKRHHKPNGQTSETYHRDCARPNRPGCRKLRVTGQAFTITASASDNIDLEEEYQDEFGIRKDYRVTLYEDDCTDGCEALGTYAY